MEYIAGIDLGGTNIKAVLVDRKFNIVNRAMVPTPFQKSPEMIFCRIIQVVEELLTEKSIDKSKLEGIGIGIPGLTDSRTNIAHEVKFLKWRNTDVAAPIHKHFGVPVFAENDGSINTLGEFYFGAGRGYKNIILLTIGTRLGGGIIINGELLYGHGYVAGEVGHMVIESNGELCVCGKRGCLESYCSGSAMIRYARKTVIDYPESVLLKYTNNDIFAINGEMISHGFDEGDKACVETINYFAEKLSIGLVNFIDIFNPGIIIIGGGVSCAGERILAPTRELVSRSLMHPSQECEIVTGQLYTDAGVLGACAVAARSLGLADVMVLEGKNTDGK